MAGLLHRIPRRGALIAVLLGLSVWLPPLGPATGETACTVPPSVFPEDQLRPGMVGTGYTVVKGTEPVPFDVEILGVLPDGIAPGIDFVLVQASGPVIDQTGGIAYGFSGSPVYIDGKLAGSISYGFWAADQTIGGLTPAQPIVDLFAYPEGAPGLGAASALASSVPLTPAMREAATEAAEGPSTASFTTARHLPLPLAVSGVNERALARLSRGFAKAGLSFAAYPSASVVRPASTVPGALEPGDAFAAVMSYGDLTWAGIGTTTAVCGGFVVAFGHPFTLEGPTAMGMSGAEVLTVVRDPSSLFGPFKIATVSESHGVLDQDRFTGVRGIEGALPSVVPVTTVMANPDLGRTRTGETDVAYQPWLSWLAGFHLLWNQDVVFDRIGDGTESLSWSIQGLREDGRTFTLKRQNMYFSAGDVSWKSMIELLLAVSVIQDNPFEEVTFTGIHAQGTITQHHLTATIARVLSASSLQPRLRDRKVLEVRPGGTIRLRVILELAEGGRRSVDLKVPVPRRGARDGALTVRGGTSSSGCLWCVFWGGGSKTEAASFDELLKDLASGEHNNDLIAELEQGTRSKKIASRQPQVILGKESVRVNVV